MPSLQSRASAAATASSATSGSSNTLHVWSQGPKRQRRPPTRTSVLKNVWKSIKLWISSTSPEKLTIGLLLMIAWGWIMVTLGMVFYHGYYGGQGRYHRPDNNSQQSDLMTMKMQPPEFQPGRASSGIPGLLPPLQNGLHIPAATTATLEPGASPLVIFTYKRSEYLRQTLDDLLQYADATCRMGCPIVISQDGRYEDVTAVIAEFQTKFQQQHGIPVVHWQHEQQAHKQANIRGGGGGGNVQAYTALAQHYKWALDKLLLNSDSEPPLSDAYATVRPQRAIILEEDLHVAPDFFDYFAALAPVLDRDATLLAVSAYNDNGFVATEDASRLLRSDFFPGLGWMLTARLWRDELSAKWPAAYWDDWLREPAQRQGRHVIRPEVSRTLHFGAHGGASSNQFGAQLTKVQLNADTTVDWPHERLEYLQPERFDRAYWQLLHAAARVDTVAAAQQLRTGDARLEYRDLKEFARWAKTLGLFSDEKAGVPRTAYKGVVEMRLRNHRFLFLTPPMDQLQLEFESVL